MSADATGHQPNLIAPEVLHSAATTLGLLSAPVRLHLVLVLTDGERDVGTLATAVGRNVARVSHHLAKLKLAGHVHSRKQGKHVVYALHDTHVAEIARVGLTHHTMNYTDPSSPTTPAATELRENAQIPVPLGG